MWSATAAILVHVITSITGTPAYFAHSALAAGLLVFVTLLWRSRRVLSLPRIALWVEEQVPAMKYGFVTAVDTKATVQSPLGQFVREHDAAGATARASVRAFVRPGIGFAFAALLFGMVSSPAFLPSLSREIGDVRRRTISAARLSPLRVTLEPPAYSRRPAAELTDPVAITGLPGSVVTVEGPGGQGGVTADISTRRLAVTSRNDRWTVRFAMPGAPSALRFRSGDSSMIIVLDPRPDNPPAVVLSTPVRDTTLRRARLVADLRAHLRDDVGLSRGYFEYLVSSGSGEQFTARLLISPIRSFGNSQRAEMSAHFDVGALKLSGGDMISMRAVAYDANGIDGPSMGVSDTRTIRIARADEYDSLSIDPAVPQPVDSSAMSQRMLVLMTEKLVRRRTRLPRPDLVAQSTEIGRMEDRIRKRVYDILYETDSPEGSAEEEEAGPEIRAIANRDLKVAYDALWDAVRSLQIAEPDRALPPMRAALAALDRARLAERVYLRGSPPRVIVDIARVRLTGKEKGVSSVRAEVVAGDSVRSRVGRRLTTALLLVPSAPSRAVEELALLRIETLHSLPAFSTALGVVTSDLRAGRNYSASLQRARSALSSIGPRSFATPAWNGG